MTTISVSPEYITSLRARLLEIKQARKGLDVEEHTIGRLLRLHDVTPGTNGSAATPKKKTKRVGGIKKSNTSEMIREHVRNHPGCTAGDVVRALIDKIETDSKKPRRYLRSAVETLVKRKDIQRARDLVGGLTITVKGGGGSTTTNGS